MMLLHILRNLFAGQRERWDPDSDETMHWLHQEQRRGEAEVARLRGLGIPLTGNILEDNATGAASRYRRYRRTGTMQ